MTGKERFQHLLEQYTLQVATTNTQPHIVQVVSELDACARAACPKSLFRFRGTGFIESEIEDVKQGIVYLSKASAFDDPKDSVAFIDKHKMRKQVEEQLTRGVFHEYIQEIVDSFPDCETRILLSLRRSVIERDFEQYRAWFINHLVDSRYEQCHKYRNTFRIACLTEDLYSTSMWGRYAEAGAGFAIEYLIPDSGKVNCSCRDHCCINGANMASVYPVIYDTQYNSTDLSHIIMHEHRSSFIPTAADYLVQVNTLIRKTANWSEQKEWRLVCPDCDQLFLRSSDSTMYANLPAKAIYIGYKALDDTKQKLIALSKDYGIPVFQAHEDDSSLDATFSFTLVEE